MSDVCKAGLNYLGKVKMPLNSDLYYGLHIFKLQLLSSCSYLSRVMRKPTMWFPNKSDTNLAVQVLEA